MALGTCLGPAVDRVRFITQLNAYRVQAGGLKEDSWLWGPAEHRLSLKDIATLQLQKPVFMASYWPGVVRLSSFQEQLDIQILKCKVS